MQPHQSAEYYQPPLYHGFSCSCIHVTYSRIAFVRCTFALKQWSTDAKVISVFPGEFLVMLIELLGQRVLDSPRITDIYLL